MRKPELHSVRQIAAVPGQQGTLGGLNHALERNRPKKTAHVAELQDRLRKIQGREIESGVVEVDQPNGFAYQNVICAHVAMTRDQGQWNASTTRSDRFQNIDCRVSELLLPGISLGPSQEAVFRILTKLVSPRG